MPPFARCPTRHPARGLGREEVAGPESLVGNGRRSRPARCVSRLLWAVDRGGSARLKGAGSVPPTRGRPGRHGRSRQPVRPAEFLGRNTACRTRPSLDAVAVRHSAHAVPDLRSCALDAQPCEHLKASQPFGRSPRRATEKGRKRPVQTEARGSEILPCGGRLCSARQGSASRTAHAIRETAMHRLEPRHSCGGNLRLSRRR